MTRLRQMMLEELVRRDRQHPFLRFHCAQCLLFWVLFIPVIYWTGKDETNIASMVFVVLFLVYLVTMIQAGRRKMCKLPVLGGIAERLSLGSKV